MYMKDTQQSLAGRNICAISVCRSTSWRHLRETFQTVSSAPRLAITSISTFSHLASKQIHIVAHNNISWPVLMIFAPT